MAKIDRYNGNVKAVGSEALGTERTIFGSTDQSDTLDANITTELLRGWGIVGVNENPTKQDFNGLAFTLGQLIAYLHQRGVAEWNTSQEYYEGSVVTTLEGIYKLKAGGDGTVDPDTDSGVNWDKAAFIADLISEASGSGASLVSMENGPTVQLAVSKLNQVPRPNILINGGFAIIQRGTSFPLATTFTVTVARWVFGKSGGTSEFTVSRLDDAPTVNSEFSLNAEVTTAHPTLGSLEEAHIRYALEGRQAGLKIRDKIVTLSFWVKSNFPGTYSIAIVKPNSAGSAEETYLDSYTIASSGVWEKKSITINLSESTDRTWRLNNNYAIKLRFSYYAGPGFSGSVGWQSGNLIAVSGGNNLAATVGNYLRIAEVKLEDNEVSTPYVEKAINQELSDVQRYELIIGSNHLDSVGISGYAAAIAHSIYHTISYPATMRAAPVVTLISFGITPNNGQPVFLAGVNSGTLKLTATASGRIAARSGNSPVPIFLDAEL